MDRFFSLILLAMTISVSAIADDINAAPEAGPVTDVTAGQAIVMALIANPDIGERLRKEGFSHVGQMTRQQVQPGITEYVIRVGTCGNCRPISGTVRITENMRPTYNDGSIAYSFSVHVDAEH